MRRLAIAIAVAALTAGACGGGEKAAPVKPANVPVEIVPATLADGTLTLQEDATARKAFSTIGDRALVADGRLWTIRQGERLIATLQISTLKPRVDLLNEKERESVINNVLPGTKQRISVNDVSVVQTDSSDKKTVYLWFGRSLFEVLQVKGSKIDPEQILAELVEFQKSSPHWKPLPKPADESDE